MRRTLSIVAAMSAAVGGVLAADVTRSAPSSTAASAAASATAPAVAIALAPIGERGLALPQRAAAPPVHAVRPTVRSESERPQKMLLLLMMRAAAAAPGGALLRSGD
jgi:hypothetical protein